MSLTAYEIRLWPPPISVAKQDTFLECLCVCEVRRDGLKEQMGAHPSRTHTSAHICAACMPPCTDSAQADSQPYPLATVITPGRLGTVWVPRAKAKTVPLERIASLPCHWEMQVGG